LIVTIIYPPDETVFLIIQESKGKAPLKEKKIIKILFVYFVYISASGDKIEENEVQGL